MGGRGGSYLRSAYMAVSVTGSDGAEIDLSDSPLAYGDNDPYLTGAVRKATEEFENRRYKNKIEFARLVDEYGNVIEENKGGHGSVRSTVGAYKRAKSFTHNHPRSGPYEKGVLGGTFSNTDLDNFVHYNPTTFRATAAEGTYSISKTAKFNGSGFKQYYTKAFTQSRSAYVKAMNNLKDSYYSGKISSYQAYSSASHKEFNKYLVSLHNTLRAGQKLYGYNYTLERR